MPSSTRGSLSMASTRKPLSGSPADGRAERRSRATGAGARAPIGASTANTEPLPGRERSLDGMAEHAPEPLHDRKAEPEPARGARALIEPQELVEDRRCLSSGIPEPGVPDLDAHRAAAPAAADEHAALRAYI